MCHLIGSSESSPLILVFVENIVCRKCDVKIDLDLLVHLHIVRRNMACFCKAVQVTRHNLFHHLNHDKVLNKKYNIYFLKTNMLLGNFLSVPAYDFYKVAPQSAPSIPGVKFVKFYITTVNIHKTNHTYFSLVTQNIHRRFIQGISFSFNKMTFL